MDPGSDGVCPQERASPNGLQNASDNEAQQRQVAVVIIMSIEESELLLAMRGIFRGIKIDGDAPHLLTAPSLLLLLNH